MKALAAYRNRKTYPAAATYIRVGLAFGGNYESFLEGYVAALTALGPVPHLIIDEEGLDEKSGYFFEYSRQFPALVRQTDEFDSEAGFGRRQISLYARI